ncbi:hypothetical protein [Pseudofrankia inefficax]|uniref:hypothetical protein n=1 Tax=Pseudofrankia inefficax (strain DSM 45817 / CECT 9037 / DDB 130130 / EuI1c) TaxID=298654 RepID=UPI0003229E69|nr:hypothetical protein [Pseudofrankia inefficax]
MGAYSAHNGRHGRRATRLATGVTLAAVLGLAWSGSASAALAAGSPTGASSAGTAQAPIGTVTRAGSYLVDGNGRMFVPHGLMVPAGVTPTAAELDAWVQAGFDAAGVTVPLSAAGRFPDPTTGATVNDPGLVAAGNVVRALTNRGFVVALRVVPVGGATVAPTALQAALRRLAAAFRDTGGLTGYELPHAQTKDAAAVLAGSAAIAAVDPFHLLWREQPASFQPAATVAVNDPTGYLTSWPGGDAALAAFTAAADGNTIGWLYPAPAAGPLPPALARAYPLAIAGTPASFGTDTAGTFTLRYAPGTLPSGKPTPAGWVSAVSLPAAAYPTGYTLTLTGARLVSRPGSALLCVAAQPGATEVSLTVTRATAGSAPTPVPYAGAQACADPTVAAAPSAPATNAAARTDTATKKDDYSGPLLWALPLLGAAVMALLLVVPFRLLRGLRVGTGRTGSRSPFTDPDDTPAPDERAGAAPGSSSPDGPPAQAAAERPARHRRPARRGSA